MNTLIIYDSQYGNTEKIAVSIGNAISGEVKVLHVSEADASELKTLDLLIVGSPTHGGRQTPAIDEFLRRITSENIKNLQAAAFDTRFAPEDHGIGLRLLMNVIRFAAERIAKDLQKKGGRLVGKPEGFIVEDKEGPLKHGELERAAAWGVQITETVERRKTNE